MSFSECKPPRRQRDLFGFSWIGAKWPPLVLLLCVSLIAAATQATGQDGTWGPHALRLVMLDITCAALMPWGVWWQGLLNVCCMLSFLLTYIFVPAPRDALLHGLAFLSVMILSPVVADLLARRRTLLTNQSEAINLGEKTFIRIFAANTDITVIISLADETCLDVNNEFERVTGYSREETLNRTLRDITFWAAEDDLVSVLKEVRANGVVRNITAEFVTKTGERRLGLFSAMAINLGTQECILLFVRDITEEKLTEEAMRRMAAIVESSEDAIVSTTLDGTVSTWNGGAERLFGYLHSEIVGKPLSTFLGADVWSQARELVQKIAEGERALYEAVRFSKDGRPVAVLVSLSPIYDGPQRVIGVSCIYKDITEWRRAERELIKSEAKFKKVFEASMDAITINTWAEGRYVAVNDEFERISGYNRQDVVGKTTSEVGIWVRPEQRRELLAELRARGNIRNFEVEFAGKGGKIFSILASAAIVDFDGEPCVVSFVRDISDRKGAEETRSLLAAIVQSSDDSIMSGDLNWKITSWNPGAEKLYGYSAAEIIGQPLDVLIPCDHLDEIRGVRAAIVRNIGVRRLESKRVKKDGTLFDAAITVSPIYDAGGSVIGISAITKDITQQKRSERELIEAREQALAGSRAKSEFLATMSHEIRTPMNAIIGMTELLSEDGSLTSEQRRYVRIAKTAGDTLLSLIDNILDLSKIEGGHLHLEEIDFDVEDLVKGSVDTFRLRAHEKGLEMLFHIASEVPSILRGDPTRLRQVLINLIGNAVRFTEHGEIVVTVEKEPGPNDLGALLFSVCDTGIGIPKDKADAVFESFTQVDSSTTRRYGGSGLGLAICKRLIDLMGGKIWLESEPGKGSRFFFTINVGVSAQARQENVKPEINLKEFRVLIADDNASHRKIVRETLEQCCALVTEAVEWDAAVRELHRAFRAGTRYQLLLLDDSIANTEGLQFLERSGNKKAIVDTAILMIAPTDPDRDVERARQPGVETYLIKPIARRDLLRAVQAAQAKCQSEPEVHSETVAAASSQRKLRILLAEDSEDNRILVQEYLKSTPYQLESAENGDVAVTKFTSNKYDLVLMDMQMPVMDGYAAVRAIREWECITHVVRTPVVALTAYALKEEVVKSFEAGCDVHLSKPIKKKTLLEAIVKATQSPSDGSEKDVVEIEEDLAPLLPRFLQRKRDDLLAICNCLEQRDYERIGVIGHNIKGEGGGFGLNALSEIGSFIEKAAREKDPERLHVLVEELANCLNEVEAIYRYPNNGRCAH